MDITGAVKRSLVWSVSRAVHLLFSLPVGLIMQCILVAFCVVSYLITLCKNMSL